MEKNEAVDVIDTPINNDTVETVEAETEIVDTTPEVKPKSKTLEEQRVELEARLRRVKNKLGLVEEEIQKPVLKKPKELDYGEKAFLISNGIKGKDEFQLVSDMLADTGKHLEDLVDSKYFQTQLKEMRQYKESKLASDATAGSKNGQSSARDTAEYWIAKGELPPTHMPTLRREVVNAKIKAATQGNHFTDTPVIS